ncbi:VanZ family protein [Cellulomonas xylanilytica]|uniref:VanZ family protein n=1 Tax=Cellulomonas xylanilytica TaxID=233583 RepID=UPI002483183C|nr:VanZ family protein [Cellulomonas xylanilytica]
MTDDVHGDEQKACDAAQRVDPDVAVRTSCRRDRLIGSRHLRIPLRNACHETLTTRNACVLPSTTLSPVARTRRQRVSASVALAAYLAVVARITLSPEPASDATFAVVRGVLAWLVEHGVPLTYPVLEAVANVVMFVPFGVLVGLLVRRAWVVVALATTTSAAIELNQLLFLASRVATVQDVVLNTLGAVVGLGMLRVLARRRASCRPSAYFGDGPARVAEDPLAERQREDDDGDVARADSRGHQQG